MHSPHRRSDIAVAVRKWRKYAVSVFVLLGFVAWYVMPLQLARSIGGIRAGRRRPSNADNLPSTPCCPPSFSRIAFQLVLLFALILMLWRSWPTKRVDREPNDSSANADSAERGDTGHRVSILSMFSSGVGMLTGSKPSDHEEGVQLEQVARGSVTVTSPPRQRRLSANRRSDVVRAPTTSSFASSPSVMGLIAESVGSGCSDGAPIDEVPSWMGDCEDTVRGPKKRNSHVFI